MPLRGIDSFYSISLRRIAEEEKMKENEIIRDIEDIVKRTKGKYSIWYIGITNDPKRRRKEHEEENKNTKAWRDWKADTEAIARSVESYFKKKGMDGGTGGGENPTFVYIF